MRESRVEQGGSDVAGWVQGNAEGGKGRGLTGVCASASLTEKV